MGFKLAELYAEIGVNDKKLDTGLAAAKAKVVAAALSMKAAFAAVAPELAVLTGAAGFAKAVFGAADLAETVSKVDVVFGDAAGTVKTFGTEMAAAFGSNRKEVLDSAAGFGLIAKAAGLTKDASAGLAVNFARLADDASSFYNVPLVDALGTIKSALVGESEPIRRFGVLLNEDAVKAEALALGLSAAKAELTEGAKVMARASLIQKGLADATGDHARTMSSFTNQWREFLGRAEDVAVTMGGAVLPVFNSFLRILNPITKALQAVAEGIARAGQAAEGFAVRMLPLLGGDKGAIALGKSLAGLGPAAQPGGGAGKAAAGLAAAGAGAAKPTMADARRAVVEENLAAEKKRLVAVARLEDDAAKLKEKKEKDRAAIFRRTWVEAETQRLRDAVARGTDLNNAFVAQTREKASKAYSLQLARKAMGGAKGDKFPAYDKERNAAEKAVSIGKEKLNQGLAVLGQFKQQGLATIGQGLVALVEANQKSIDKTEQKERGLDGSFDRQRLEGGRDFSSLVQSKIDAAFGMGKNSPEREIAANTKHAVEALEKLLTAFQENTRRNAGALFAP